MSILSTEAHSIAPYRRDASGEDESQSMTNATNEFEIRALIIHSDFVIRHSNI